WGSCVPLGSGDVPYAPLIDALRRLVRSTSVERVRELAGPAYPYLASLLTGVVEDGSEQARPSGDGAGERSRLFAAVLRLMDQLGREAPVVLVIEGLHWVDQSTLDFLSYLSRAWTDERLLVV